MMFVESSLTFSRHFNTVNHNILLEKWILCSICKLANNWSRPCLKFCIKKTFLWTVLCRTSRQFHIPCGDLQLFTLGPLLFLLYIIDLHYVFSRLTLHRFANDINLKFPSKKLELLNLSINDKSKHLVQWFKVNKFWLNETNTELIMPRLPWKRFWSESNIRLWSCKLKVHTHIKYLGVFMDEVLL